MVNKKVGAVEIVHFSFKENLSDEEATKNASLVNEFIQEQKGFISRTTSKLGDNKWMDIVYWESLREAKAAAEAAMKCGPCGEFFSTLDEKTIQLVHGEVMVQLN